MAGKEFSGTTNNTTKWIHEHLSGISFARWFHMMSKRILSFISSIPFTMEWVGLFDYYVEYPTSPRVKACLAACRSLTLMMICKYRSILPGYGGTIRWIPWYCGGKFRRCCKLLPMHRRWGRSSRQLRLFRLAVISLYLWHCGGKFGIVAENFTLSTGWVASAYSPGGHCKLRCAE